MMTQAQVDELPRAQSRAMLELQENSGIPWSEFLERALPPTNICPEVGILGFHGMYVGIEPDGYTHS